MDGDSGSVIPNGLKGSSELTRDPSVQQNLQSLYINDSRDNLNPDKFH